jgi:hypothetical protein
MHAEPADRALLLSMLLAGYFADDVRAAQLIVPRRG